MTYKCCCPTPDIGNWTRIRISGRDYIVRCNACEQVWHTTASYAESLPEQQITQFEWKQIIKSEQYHKGEDTVAGEPDGYLDPDFESRFTEDTE